MSNEVIKGPLGPVRENQYRGKTLYSATLDNDDRWFGLGGDNPAANSGDMVEVEIYQNDKGYWQGKNLKKIASAPAGNVAQAASAASSGYDARQNSIMLQSSRNAAVELLKIAVEQGGISLPAKKGDKLPALVAALDELTADMYKSLVTFDFEAAVADDEDEEAGFNPNPDSDGDE